MAASLSEAGSVSLVDFGGTLNREEEEDDDEDDGVAADVIGC